MESHSCKWQNQDMKLNSGSQDCVSHHCESSRVSLHTGNGMARNDTVIFNL